MTDLSLDGVVDELDRLVAAGDPAAAGAFLEQHLVAVWCGVHPDRLREICAWVLRTEPDAQGRIDGLFLIAAAPTDSFALHDAPGIDDEPFTALHTVGRMLGMRVRGRTADAMAQLALVDRAREGLRPPLDRHDGWQLMAAVQCGITAMLGGNLQRALGYFTAAQLAVPSPALTVLTRDAYVKAALIHATAGNTDEARFALAHAASLERTSGWAEAHIDVNAAIAEALLEREDPELALQLIERIRLNEVGEMWPFYIIAVHRVFVRAGRYRELADRVARFEQVPFPSTEGEGLAGSVFPVLRSTLAYYQGDLESAIRLTRRADQENFLTLSMTALLEAARERPHRALATAHRLAPLARGLRQAEIWRYSALADAYLQLGRTAEAQESLEGAYALSNEIRSADLAEFSPRIRAFAATRITGWPVAADAPPPRERLDPAIRLTRREREILALLAEGISRSDVAERLFISLNTLKSHLRGLYRKLGVTTREAALLRADREGWLRRSNPPG